MGLPASAYDIDITKQSHIFAIIDEIETSQNTARKKQAYISYECQEGRQKEHVFNRVKELYPDTYMKFRIGDVAIVDKVITKKGKAYKTTPLRLLKDPKESQFLSETYERFKFGLAFKEADRIFNLHKYVCLWLSYINPRDGETKGNYNLQALAPYEYDLIRDEQGKPVVFILSYGDTDITGGADGIEQTITEDQRDTSAETKKYSFWTKDYFVRVVVRTKKVGGKKELLNIVIKDNQIDRLPIAFLSKSTAVDYPIPSALASRSIDWNVEMSDLKTAAATQGHGQLVIKHPETMKQKKMHMGMHTAINLPQSKKESDKPTEADYISASPDLNGQLGILQFSLTQILDDEGITAKSAIKGGVDEAASGFDRILKEADVQDLIEDNQSLYSDSIEQDVYLCLKGFEIALNSSTLRTDKLQVTFEKPKVLITDKETLENIDKREELGTLLDYEKHIIINPNLSIKEAQQREADIQLQKGVKAAKVQSILGDKEEDKLNDE